MSADAKAAAAPTPGIVSSRSGSVFALGFDMKRVMRTRYRIDDFQQTCFVIDRFNDLLKQTLETDFAPIYAELAGQDEHTPADILPTDRVFTRGAQAWAQSRSAA